MEKIYMIIDLYYTNKYKVIDIAKQLDVSKQYVSKVIKSDNRYLEEKTRRKEETRAKADRYRKQHMKEKRIAHQDEINFLKKMHEQARAELSDRKGISNTAYRDWNSSIYKYNKNKKSYELKKGITVSSDIPKKVKWGRY